MLNEEKLHEAAEQYARDYWGDAYAGQADHEIGTVVAAYKAGYRARRADASEQERVA